MSLSDSELVQAVFASNAEAVRRLICSKADVNASDTVDNTPLAVAAYHGDVDLTFTLLDAGAAVDSRDPGGATALMVAAKQGHGAVARLLVAHGADQTATDRGSGATALQLAQQRGDEEVISLLDPSAVSARKAFEEEDDDEDEDELASELALSGNVMAVEHVVKLDAPLVRFDWIRYEETLAKLAGVRAVDVLVTPEPGSVCIEAHATIIVRLPQAERPLAATAKPPPTTLTSGSKTTSAAPPSVRGALAASGGLGGKSAAAARGTLRATAGGGVGTLRAAAGGGAPPAGSHLSSAVVDRVSAMVQALKRAPALKQAAGGAPLVGTPQVRLLGDVATEDDGLREAAQQLLSLRPQHDDAREMFEGRRRELKAVGGADAGGALALEASKAILGLRGPREALQEAAAKAAAAKEQRRRRR